MKATELYFLVILFIVLFYVESVKDILGCDHSNEYGGLARVNSDKQHGPKSSDSA